VYITTVEEAAMQKWEYTELSVDENLDEFGYVENISAWLNGTQTLLKVVPSVLYEYLNKLGEKGWELIAIRTSPLRYYFKRPKM